MKLINEYLSTKIKKSQIIADDDNIKEIVRKEISRLGNNADLNHIDTSKVTNMESVFRLRQFNGDISEWNVSNVTNMNYMFQGTLRFNCDLRNWDVSNVKSMTKMFSADKEFEGNGLENWKISPDITYMDGMFLGCENLKADLSEWKLNGRKLNDVTAMFKSCRIFECDLSSWEISKYAIRTEMFKFCPIIRKKNLQPKYV